MFFQIRPGVERLPTAPLRRCVFEPCAAPWPCEIVLLHYALKTFALRRADHIDPIARLKLRDAQIDLALGRIRLEAKFLHQFLRLGARRLEFTQAAPS